MSQFIDRLKQIDGTAPRPMGFRAARAEARKTGLQLIASVSEADVSLFSGADAGLLPVSIGGKNFRELGKVAGIPCGVWLGGDEEIEPLVAAGADFVVFAAGSRLLSVLKSEKLGRVLAVEFSLGDGLVRAAGDLPVDAVLITGGPEKDAITFEYLMNFRRFAGLLTKPLLASVPSDVTADELGALWDAGVSGVVVGVGAGSTLTELRRVVDGLTFLPRRKRDRLMPKVPFISGEAEVIPEEEEEEEEEEED